MANAVQNIQHRTRIVKFNLKQRIVARHHDGLHTFIIAQQQLAAWLGSFDERTCASTRFSSSIRSTSTSIFPPLALRPKIRAGITRVLLKTSRSPGLSWCNKSVNTP